MVTCRPMKQIKKSCYFIVLFVISLLVFNLLWQSAHSVDDLGYLSRNSGKLHLNREKNDKIIGSLHHQVEDLKKLLEVKTKQLSNAKKLTLESEDGGHVEGQEDSLNVYQDGDSIMHFVNEKIQKSEILNGALLRNENEVNHFVLFDSHYIHQLNSELNNKPQDIWSNRHELRRELLEVISKGVRSLNDEPDRRQVSPTYWFKEQDFLHGMYRTEKGIGTQYELIYKPRSSANIMNGGQLFRVTLFRPFAPLRKISTSGANEKETIYFIVPLRGRSDTFRVFIEYFKKDAVPDSNVHLTVVLFGDEGLSEVKELLASLEQTNNFVNYKLITANDEFSRGKALQRGVDSLTASNPLMFFCDVDVAFTPDFLNQCRSYTSPGKMVFFPIVFSLYNPSIVYDKLAIPSLKDRQSVKKDHGFWRDFGFGMSCQYLSDFRSVDGFDLSIKGWGTEDLRLYRKYTKSDIRIIRSPVNSLFHHWHPKLCDKGWSTEQYESCLKSRIRNEGSVLQLGAKYFEVKEKLESKE